MYYRVLSSHWHNVLEFKSEVPLEVGQFFRITSHDGYRPYPTRFKVISKSDTPSYVGPMVTIKSVDFDVEPIETLEDLRD
jgi:hypothetical protein